MPITKEFYIPSEKELTVDEVNISLSGLRAGSLHLGKYCEKQNNEFMLCRYETKDPRKCLQEGREVTSCALDFFRKIKSNCCKEFKQFSYCLYRSDREMGFKKCRNTQAAFDKCVLDKMNFEKPPFGWQAEVHIHHTDRPKPKPEISHFPDAPDSFPHDKIKPKAPRFGGSSSEF